MIGFTRPKRFCVPENKHYTAVERKALDALESACERANIETARMKALLREALPSLDYLVNAIGDIEARDVATRIRAALGDDSEPVQKEPAGE